MIDISTILRHYKRPDVQREIIINSKNKEVAAKFQDKFGNRPDALTYPSDILELAKQGVTSFHASEELWSNPLQLTPTLTRKELERLRIGWDLVLDIDCNFIEYSKIAADLIIKLLKYHNISSISCKFSGNKGFHIGIPFEAFPKKVSGIETKLLFPEAPRRIAFYLKEMIKRRIGEKIMELENNNFSKILEKTETKENDIIYYKKDQNEIKRKYLNAEPFLNIDTILISSRHLYRMPYTFNEKSGLLSIPIDPDKVLQFKKEMAMPKNLQISKFRFLDKTDTKENEAKQLIIEALDFSVKKQENIQKKENFETIQDALPEPFFPPCIKKILNGLEDGRKRSLFILINFLSSVGWDYDKIEKTLKEWNKKNKEPLREVYLIGQLRYHKSHKKKILPPNCQNMMYYKDIAICIPDELCKKIKNPVNFSIIKAKKNKLYK